MEIRDKVHIGARRRPHGVDIEAVSGERRSKNTPVDEKLGGLVGVLGDLAADGARVPGAVPVEVERDEDLHPVVGRRLVGKVELLVRVAVDADVEGEGVDTCVLGPTHVIVILGGAGAFTNDTDLAKKQLVSFLFSRV
jgi:hypothetical protein